MTQHIIAVVARNKSGRPSHLASRESPWSIEYMQHNAGIVANCWRAPSLIVSAMFICFTLLA
jgi:hypothetical protein